MKQPRRVLARIDSCCARMNGGLTIIALVLASLVVAMASFHAPSLFPPTVPSPQSPGFLVDDD